MSNGGPAKMKTDHAKPARRHFLKKLGGLAAAGGVATATHAAWGGHTLSDTFADFFQQHYREMSDIEIRETLERIERKAKNRYGVDIRCKDTAAIEGVLFGYAINVSKCRGYRDCVHACVKENNLSRDTQYIRVLELDRDNLNLHEGDHYYNSDTVPVEGKHYFPMQCMHCDNPPCVKACPVEATWTEPDGIVVVDYDWCIGCRYCMAACPYQARHFNWGYPKLPAEEITTETHYLGNRPRPRGVVEKCHFCVQRTREGRQPACQEACPSGARVFGNLLDPNSEIRYVLENKAVFRLKEDLGTEPKFWYFRDR
ncbi:MAG: 4Fe-4S dicluster domain-containing protein [Gammaproteobacteria bacterium]|nr:4Fe-4S dicluster domain-containing protein [Gammaproteobacteria bacterium]MDX2487713.1 4Fe-4S dicluster domain-containing protein [Gammaproteobacteria bacterium]